MAHTGEKLIFRLVQLLDLLFLPLGQGIFLIIHPILEHEQQAGKQSHHHHGKRGVNKIILLAVLETQLREIKGDAITKHRFQRTQSEKRHPSFPAQSDADKDKA